MMRWVGVALLLMCGVVIFDDTEKEQEMPWHATHEVSMDRRIRRIVRRRII